MLSPIVELRQYTLHPDGRDVLIELFDREFVESQEALGMAIIGQFRDLDDPDRFVWLRGFEDMASRRQGLEAFYGGPVWKEHREVANTTMIDSSDVLLLRPARSDSAFQLDTRDRPAIGAPPVPGGMVAVTVYPLAETTDGPFVDYFERTLVPALTEQGTSVLAYFETEPSVNDFPALPVREGESVFAWFSGSPALDKRKSVWGVEIEEELARRTTGPPTRLWLSPTPRSLLRARATPR